MIILHSDKNTLVQQVQENLENILSLAGKIKDVYYTSDTLTEETASIEVSATDIVESEYTGGWLLDSEANLFNIVTISDGVAYLKFYANVKGVKGDQGDSCTVKIGKTTTLDAGSVATVTNSGTDVNAVLNFGIPKGVNGKNIYSASYAIDNPDPTSTVFLEYTKTNIPDEDYSEATLVGAFILDSNSEIYEIIAFSDLGEGSYMIVVQFFESIKGKDGADGKDGENGKDGTGINSITDVKFNTIDKVTYADNTAVITGGFAFTDTDGNEINTSGTITLPIEAGDNVTIDANESDDAIIVSVSAMASGLYSHKANITLTDSSNGSSLTFLYSWLSSSATKEMSDVINGKDLIDFIIRKEGFSIETEYNQSVLFTSVTVQRNAFFNMYYDEMEDGTFIGFYESYINISSGTATRVTNSITGFYDTALESLSFDNDLVTINYEAIASI